MWFKINNEHINLDNVRKIKFGNGWIKLTFDIYSMLITNKDFRVRDTVPIVGKVVNLSGENYETIEKKLKKIVE